MPALAESFSSSPLAPPPLPPPAQYLKSGGIHNEDGTSVNDVVTHEYETKRMAWRQEIEGLTSKNRVLTTALDDAITALAAARDNVSAHALQVASLTAELAQEKKLRRRAQGIADELADRVLRHRESKENSSLPSKKTTVPEIKGTKSYATPEQNYAHTKKKTDILDSKRKLEKSVHFDEFESVAEYTPGSHTAALGIPCLQSPTKRTALQNRRVDEPVTPAKELLAHPSKQTTKHKAYCSIRTPKTKSRHRVRLALELGCLAGRSLEGLRIAAIKALKQIEEANHKAFILLDDDPTSRAAFRGLYVQSSNKDNKENACSKKSFSFSRMFGSGPKTLSMHDVTSFFSWNDVEKRLVRVKGPPPAIIAKPKIVDGKHYNELAGKIRTPLLINQPWQIRTPKALSKLCEDQDVSLGPTIVALGTNKISLKYLRKAMCQPKVSAREPVFELFERTANE